MNRKRIIRNTFIYIFLIVGYLYLYLLDIEEMINPEIVKQVKSKVEFIYSQF